MADERLPFIKDSDDAIRRYEKSQGLEPSFSDEQIGKDFAQIEVITKAAEKAQQTKDERLTKKGTNKNNKLTSQQR